MTFEFLLCVGVLFALAGIGAPIAYAILVAVLVYLLTTGQGLGVAGKILMDGLYQSFILLAVPLFIVAANIMNAGTISDRLLSFCVALVGRFRGGLGHVNVVASLIFSGMSGSAVAEIVIENPADEFNGSVSLELLDPESRIKAKASKRLR